MALTARARLRRRVLVRLVAAQAVFARVNLHGRRVVLFPEVTVRTVTGLVRMRGQCGARGVGFQRAERPRVREAMAEGAVAIGGSAQPRGSLLGCVRQASFFGVTLGAALRFDGPDLALADGVAVVARHLVLQDVYVVTPHLSDVAPNRRDVDAPPWMWSVGTVATRASDQQRQH